MVTLYGIKNCDTVRKALKAFESAGSPVSFVDVRADGLSSDTVAGWLKHVSAEVLLNRRGTTWRQMNEAEQAAALEDPAAAIAATPTLFKRPVITDGEKVTVGWKAPEQGQWLG
ncbi:MAG: ArsC/Spx/MgsR family protein [Pseudomonadota bacterium]